MSNKCARRRTFIGVVIFVAAMLVLSPTLNSRAWSVPINTLLAPPGATTDNRQNFKWTFTWDNTRPGPLDPLTYFPPGFKAWSPRVSFPLLGDDIVFRAVHNIGPHQGIDRPDSGDFVFTLKNASTLPFGVSLNVFPATTEPHFTFVPPDHSDRYTGLYTKPGPAPDRFTLFEWRGEHLPVPGPTTLLLFGTTAAGLGLARWRQRRRKQQ